MKGIRPCPYCGSEVEVIKLIKKPNDKKQPYRIECRKCRALVARGQGCPNETAAEMKERIDQYHQIMERKRYPNGPAKIATP